MPRRRRPSRNDIRIGERAWITFGSLGDGQAHAIPIDPWLAPILPFFEALETSCNAECCGIDAFSLFPGAIRQAAGKYDHRDLEFSLSTVAAVQSEIAALPSDIVVSTRLNQYFRKVVFLELLSHIRNTLASSG
jgi:hypothetical protein